MSLRAEVCVVTGAAGFLGRRLVQLLLEEEDLAEVRLLDKRVPPELLQKLQASRGSTELGVFEGDIRDSDYVRRACRGASVIIHTAAVIDVINAVPYSEMYGVNVKGTQVLLEACIQENVPSFVLTSSIEVLGPNSSGEPIVNGSEDTLYHSSPGSDYSSTKKEAELSTLRAHGELLRDGGRLATCALRPMYIFGEGCRFLLGHMSDGIQNGGVLFRVSKRDAYVNPVYVGNVAAGLLQAARALKDPARRRVIGGKSYFLSDDTPPVSYSDFNHLVMAPLGFAVDAGHVLPLRLLYVLCFLWEMVCAVLKPLVRLRQPLSRQLLNMLNTTFTFSYQGAKKDMGYEPRYTWEQARRGTMEWLAAQLPKERERILSSWTFKGTLRKVGDFITSPFCKT